MYPVWTEKVLDGFCAVVAERTPRWPMMRIARA
jgi:hypothetical protein